MTARQTSADASLATHSPGVSDLFIDGSCDIARRCQPETIIPGRLGGLVVVYPDYLAMDVHQGAAVVDGINNCVRLDIYHRVIRDQLASSGAYNPHREAFFHLQLISKRKDQLSSVYLARIAKL